MNCSLSSKSRDGLRARLLRDLGRDPGMLILAYPYARSWGPIGLPEVRDGWSRVEGDRSSSLYVHIPFCDQKCAFCDFLAYYNRPPNEIDEYLVLLGEELRMVSGVAGRLRLEAVQFGGGTPSLLSPKQMGSLLDAIQGAFSLASGAEVALEVFPDKGVSDEFLRGWKRAGINRLSFGIQTFDDSLKRAMGRPDSSADNLALIERAVAVGFENFNVDLMCGVPNQTPESWAATVQTTLRLEPAHVCVFPVSVRHPGTHFYQQRSDLPAIEATRSMYDHAVGRLREEGFERTTKHDFARPGFEYRYEQMIAELAPLVGVGANCINYSRDCIYRNHSDLSKYAETVRRGELPVRAGHVFSDDERPNNYAVRNIEYLRLSGDAFAAEFGVPLKSAFGIQIDLFEELGLARMEADDLVLTEEGVYFTSAVKRALFHPKAWERFETMRPEEFVIERGGLRA